MTPLPTHAVTAPWLWGVVLLPLLGLARRRPAAVLGLAGAGLTALGALAVALRQSPDATVAAPPWILIDGHGLRFASSLSATPLGLVVCVAACAAWLRVERRSDAESHATAPLLIRSLLLLGVLAGDHLTLVVAIVTLGWLAGSTALQSAGWAWLAGAAALAWGLGSSGWNERGELRLVARLGAYEGREAIRRITEARLPPVPIGVDEAIANGDRTGEGARWIVPGPTFDVIDTTDQLRVPSTGQDARLSAMTRHGLPVRDWVTTAWLAAALLVLLGAFDQSARERATWLAAAPVVVALARSRSVLEPTLASLVLAAGIVAITALALRWLEKAAPPAPSPSPRTLPFAGLLLAAPLACHALAPSILARGASWWTLAAGLASLAAGARAVRVPSPWLVLIACMSLQVSALATLSPAGLAAAIALGVGGTAVALGSWRGRAIPWLAALAPGAAFAGAVSFAATAWACVAALAGFALVTGALARAETAPRPGRGRG